MWVVCVVCVCGVRCVCGVGGVGGVRGVRGVRGVWKLSKLPETQFAFRRLHSTGDAQALLVDQLQMARDKKDSSRVCFLDISKAFDKVRHSIMIQDCFEIGVGGTVLKWLVSYLTNRTQQVCIGSELSNISVCTIGVPQGSVLGPIVLHSSGSCSSSPDP